jgi:hypothetical protein
MQITCLLLVPTPAGSGRHPREILPLVTDIAGNILFTMLIAKAFKIRRGKAALERKPAASGMPVTATKIISALRPFATVPEDAMWHNSCVCSCSRGHTYRVCSLAGGCLQVQYTLSVARSVPRMRTFGFSKR